MASLFKRKLSKFWWVKFRDPITGNTKRESTKCRVGVGIETRRAREIEGEKTALENKAVNISNSQTWDAWVPAYLEQRYEISPKTLHRYLICWKTLSVYLDHRKVAYPSQLKHADVMNYVTWRQHPTIRGIYAASRLTALLEIKMLRVLMDEAIRRKMASANPCERLGLKRGDVPEKPAITNEELIVIRENLRTEPEWMRISFEIAIHQGCRFAETCLPLSRVDTKTRRISFDAKGGKFFTTELNEGLIPLMDWLKSQKRVLTYEMPTQAARIWTRFFRKIGLPRLCFHCTRVTVITNLCRAGIPEGQAMRFIGHASYAVHRIYQRLQVEDVHACVGALHTLSSGSLDWLPTNPRRAAKSSPFRKGNDSPRRALHSQTK